MLKLVRKPVVVLGATAVLVFGAAGLSAAATKSSVTPTTPDAQHRGHGGGRTQDPTALAKALGVSVSQLETALEAARTKQSSADPASDAQAQVKAIADALDTDDATVQTILDAQRPAKGDGPKGDRPTGTTPPDRPTGTTPPKDRPTGTTPSGTNPPTAGPGRGHGGPGGKGGALADQASLVTALAAATGKTEAVVKAALTKADEAQATARKARDAEFANNLAVQLGLTESKVAAALEASRPARPTRAAKQGTTQAK